MTVYGYARVSTIGQRSPCKRPGCTRRTQHLKGKISGAASNRAQLYRPRDLLNVVDKITKAGATFRSPGGAWADTTTAHGRLMLTVLGGLTEFERD